LRHSPLISIGISAGPLWTGILAVEIGLMGGLPGFKTPRPYHPIFGNAKCQLTMPDSG
jgi:hypothetical protein